MGLMIELLWWNLQAVLLPTAAAGILHMAVVRFKVAEGLALPLWEAGLGPHKTWRGVLVMVALSSVAATVATGVAGATAAGAGAGATGATGAGVAAGALATGDTGACWAGAGTAAAVAAGAGLAGAGAGSVAAGCSAAPCSSGSGALSGCCPAETAWSSGSSSG